MENNIQDHDQDILESPFTQELIIKSDEQYDSSQGVFESQISNKIPEKGSLLNSYPVVKSEDQVDCKPYLLSLLGNDTTGCHSFKCEDQVDPKLLLLSKLGDASSDLSLKKSFPAKLPNNSSQAGSIIERKNKAEKLSDFSKTCKADEYCISRVDFGESYQNNASLDIKIDVNETKIDQPLTETSNLPHTQQHRRAFKADQRIPRRYVVIPEDQRVLLDSPDAWYDPDAVHKTQHAKIPEQVCNSLASDLSQEQKFPIESTDSSLCQWIDQERRQSKPSQSINCDKIEGLLKRSQRIPRRYFLIPSDQKALLQSSDAWRKNSAKRL
ncbi:BgTH12-03802 [Blumeria graminis f. sp. triticale]|uniref:BgTH12-03802 n=1 Tax=Blumeria graminis f. sp. triticale TaxID=1689686 RepID=A0A9W4DD88_BLUGR|nr:BgTH12-03802 [Blumeria graminis f. sp. triticale]